MVFATHEAVASLFIPSPASSTPLRLSHHLRAVALILLTVLPARVRNAAVFRRRLETVVSDELSLPALARQLPAPLLPDALRPPYYRAAFAAALHKPPTPFDAHPGTSLPPLDVWLTSLFAGSRVSPSVFVAVLVYMDRLLANCPALQLTAANVHRIVAACFVLAVKELEDNPIWTPHMAVLTGISLFELKGLEMAALRLLDYRTYIPVSEFERAEAIFIAEAVDAAEEEGLQLIMTLAAMRVTEGLDRAIAHVQSWDHMEPSHQQPAQSQGTTCVWTRVPGGPAPPRDWTVKLCATAAALADLLFPGIPLRPRRTCQPEALVLAAWGIPGVLRFRALKGLVLNAEMADLDLVLPPLVKGAHLSRDLRRVRRTHKPAMGRTGAFLVAEQWDLVQPADEDDVPLLFGERAILTPYRDATSTPPCFRPTPQPRFVALPIPDDPQHPPTHYPLGLEPCTPPPSEHLWNHWWAEKRLAQLEREFEDRVLQGMVDNGRLYAVDSPPPTPAAFAEAAAAVSSSPLVPPGFTPTLSAGGDNGGAPHGGDTLQFGSFGAIAGHSIWAAAAVPPQEQEPAAWLAQDVVSVAEAVALDVLQGDEEEDNGADGSSSSSAMTGTGSTQEGACPPLSATIRRRRSTTPWHERRATAEGWNDAPSDNGTDGSEAERHNGSESGNDCRSFLDELREERAQLSHDRPADRRPQPASVRGAGSSAGRSRRRRARYWTEAALEPANQGPRTTGLREQAPAAAAAASGPCQAVPPHPQQQQQGGISSRRLGPVAPVEQLQPVISGEEMYRALAGIEVSPHGRPRPQPRRDQGVGWGPGLGAIEKSAGWRRRYRQKPRRRTRPDPTNEPSNADRGSGSSLRLNLKGRSLRGRVSHRRAFSEVCGMQAEGEETDDSPTVVLGSRFKAAKSNSGRIIVTAM